MTVENDFKVMFVSILKVETLKLKCEKLFIKNERDLKMIKKKKLKSAKVCQKLMNNAQN